MTYCYPILSVLGVVQRWGTFGHYSIFFKPIWILKKHNLWTAWPRRHFSDKRKCAWFWCTKRLVPKFWIHDPLVRGSSGIFWKEDRLYTRSEYSWILTGPSQRQKCIVRTCTASAKIQNCEIYDLMVELLLFWKEVDKSFYEYGLTLWNSLLYLAFSRQTK